MAWHLTASTITSGKAHITILAIILFSITACSGGSSGGIVVNPEDYKEGVFIDSAVQGLQYNTVKWSGITDANGRFVYQEGELITFSIGDVILGRTQAKDIITPIDLISVSNSPRHPVVINIARLLQSLDQDGNPYNGITISESIRESLRGVIVDFTDPDLDSNPDVQRMFDILNTRGIYPEEVRGLITAEEAQIHLEETLIVSGIQDSDITVAIDSPAEDVTIEINERVNFQGSSTGGNPPVFYVWNFSGAAPDSTKQDPGNIMFREEGEYIVTLTATDNDGDRASCTVMVTVSGDVDI